MHLLNKKVMILGFLAMTGAGFTPQAIAQITSLSCVQDDKTLLLSYNPAQQSYVYVNAKNSPFRLQQPPESLQGGFTLNLTSGTQALTLRCPNGSSADCFLSDGKPGRFRVQCKISGGGQQPAVSGHPPRDATNSANSASTSSGGGRGVIFPENNSKKATVQNLPPSNSQPPKSAHQPAASAPPIVDPNQIPKINIIDEGTGQPVGQKPVTDSNTIDRAAAAGDKVMNQSPSGFFGHVSAFGGWLRMKFIPGSVNLAKLLGGTGWKLFRYDVYPVASGMISSGGRGAWDGAKAGKEKTKHGEVSAFWASSRTKVWNREAADPSRAFAAGKREGTVAIDVNQRGADPTAAAKASSENGATVRTDSTTNSKFIEVQPSPGAAGTKPAGNLETTGGPGAGSGPGQPTSRFPFPPRESAPNSGERKRP